jgi:hypothetical protein
MNRSESIKELATALSKAQGEFEHAKKDVENTFFRSKYADLASVISAAKKPLSSNGLSVVQVVDTSESGEMFLETILMHISGEFFSGKYPIKPVKNDPQAYGSCIQYARRYAFSAMTGIAAEDDDDGNAASQETGACLAPVNYVASINATKTLDALNKLWRTIPHSEQENLIAAAVAQKAKLTPQPKPEDA